MFGSFKNRRAIRDVFRQSNPAFAGRVDGLHSHSMAQHRMVSRLIQHLDGCLLAGGKWLIGKAVGFIQKADKFIDGEDSFQAVAEMPSHISGVRGKINCALPGLPTPIPIFQGLRQVPMHQRHPGLNPGSAKFIQQPFVKIEALFINRPGSFGKYSRP